MKQMSKSKNNINDVNSQDTKNEKPEEIDIKLENNNEKITEDKELFENDELDESNRQIDELSKIKDQLLRSLAENENLRKRTQKDIEQAKKYGHLFFIRDFLPSVDNLSRAVEAAPAKRENLEESVKNLILGVEIVLKEINSFLEKNHIIKIDPIGQDFDYNFHQAMYESPSEKEKSGVVLEVIQPGYLLHDRLIRPAMVGIAKNVKDSNLNKNTKDQEKN